MILDKLIKEHQLEECKTDMEQLLGLPEKLRLSKLEVNAYKWFYVICRELGKSTVRKNVAR